MEEKGKSVIGEDNREKAQRPKNKAFGERPGVPRMPFSPPWKSRLGERDTNVVLWLVVVGGVGVFWAVPLLVRRIRGASGR